MMGAEGGGSGTLNIDMIIQPCRTMLYFGTIRKSLLKAVSTIFFCLPNIRCLLYCFFFPILRLSGVKGCSFAFSQKKGGLTFLDVPYRLP